MDGHGLAALKDQALLNPFQWPSAGGSQLISVGALNVEAPLPTLRLELARSDIESASKRQCLGPGPEFAQRRDVIKEAGRLGAVRTQGVNQIKKLSGT